MKKRLIMMVLGGFLVGLVPGRATGEEAPVESEQGDAQEEAFQARLLRGVALFEQQRYGEAIVEMEAAYRIKQLPRLLFNLGQAHLKLGHSAEALRAYERYLRVAESLTPEHRQEVEGYMKTARDRMEGMDSARQVGAVQDKDKARGGRITRREPAKRRMTRAGWWGIGLTGVLAAGAGVMGGLALREWGEQRGAPVSSLPEAEEAGRRLRTLAISTDVLLGAAAVTLGTTLLAVYARRPEGAKVVVSPIPLGGGALLQAAVRF